MHKSVDKLKEKSQLILDYHRNKKTDVITSYVTNIRYLEEKRNGKIHNLMEFTVEIITKNNKYTIEEIVFDDCYTVKNINLFED